jgi:hypothetical protein
MYATPSESYVFRSVDARRVIVQEHAAAVKPSKNFAVNEFIGLTLFGAANSSSALLPSTREVPNSSPNALVRVGLFIIRFALFCETVSTTGSG